MWPDLKIQLPGFFCLLVSMCVPGMCSRALCFFPGDLSVELELVCPFQNPQTGTRFASKLLVLIKHYPASVSGCCPWRSGTQGLASPVCRRCWASFLLTKRSLEAVLSTRGKTLVRCFQERHRISDASIFTCNRPQLCCQSVPAGNNHPDGKRGKKKPRRMLCENRLVKHENALKGGMVMWGASDFILSRSRDPLPDCNVTTQSPVLVGRCQIYVWFSKRP